MFIHVDQTHSWLIGVRFQAVIFPGFSSFKMNMTRCFPLPQNNCKRHPDACRQILSQLYESMPKLFKNWQPCLFPHKCVSMCWYRCTNLLVWVVSHFRSIKTRRGQTGRVEILNHLTRFQNGGESLSLVLRKQGVIQFCRRIENNVNCERISCTCLWFFQCSH